MVIDDGGAMWLSDPWLAGAALSFAVGLVMWCHRWLETGKAPAPRNLHSRMMPMARRMSSAPEMHGSLAPCATDRSDARHEYRRTPSWLGQDSAERRLSTSGHHQMMAQSSVSMVDGPFPTLAGQDLDRDEPSRSGRLVLQDERLLAALEEVAVGAVGRRAVVPVLAHGRRALLHEEDVSGRGVHMLQRLRLRPERPCRSRAASAGRSADRAAAPATYGPERTSPSLWRPSLVNCLLPSKPRPPEQSNISTRFVAAPAFTASVERLQPFEVRLARLVGLR